MLCESMDHPERIDVSENRIAFAVRQPDEHEKIILTQALLTRSVARIRRNKGNTCKPVSSVTGSWRSGKAALSHISLPVSPGIG